MSVVDAGVSVVVGVVACHLARWVARALATLLVEVPDRRRPPRGRRARGLGGLLPRYRALVNRFTA